MKTGLRDTFLDLWKKYFDDTSLPIAFYYADDAGDIPLASKVTGRQCVVCELARVRNGASLAFNEDNIACAGGKRYLGFTDSLRPGFEYFLSCGNDKTEGERYIRTPALVSELLKNQKNIQKQGKTIIFKRWDHLLETDEPDVVIFFATPDVLSGLFTLTNFDSSDPNNNIAPFGSGCSSIVHLPYHECLSESPKAIIGMFDPSARPCVPENVLTFSVPMKRFEKMIGYMDESFLITPTWSAIRKRISKR